MSNDNNISGFKIITNGIIKENPTMRLVLGMCPTLAVSTMVKNGVGMGIAATFVLVGSNIVISLLRKVIPDKVRIPAYITIIAGFVTIVQLLLKAYFPAIDRELGIYIPLIVVNCIILARAEMFANKNNAFDSMLDGIGMGLGFTLSLTVISAVRELFGNGTLLGLPILKGVIDPVLLFILPPGGFIVLGVLMGLFNKAANRASGKGRAVTACEGCALKNSCHDNAEREIEEA